MKARICKIVPLYSDQYLVIVLKSLVFYWIIRVPVSLVIAAIHTAAASAPLGVQGRFGFETGPIWLGLTAVLLAAPVLETFFLQMLPIRVIQKFTNRPLFPIVISGLLFGAAHNFTVWDVLITTPIGFFLAWLYLFADDANRNPFVLVAFVHFLINLTVTGLRLTVFG